jgi:two-component system phosphate regulon sensor histidine kinase PhoR
LRMHGMGGSRQEVLEVQVFPYGDNHRLVLSQDVTEVERTDAMRRDFVANVSHELKTPLTVLSGFLETLRDLPLSVADRNRYLESMAQQSARMQNIIQDLLVLARLEGDARPPLNERVNMNMMAAQLREDALTLSAGRHKIEFQIDNGLDLMGAESEIHSAMGNLLINAIRYTPAGGSIQVTWGERDGRGVFCVADTGPGIPAEHIPRLTERFYRVDHSRSRDTGGTGLGLAIVKHVLQRHDAQLIVRSTVGEGSTFSAVFPNARIVRRVSAHA